MKWIVISHETYTSEFYPAHMMAKWMPAKKLNYNQASVLPPAFWEDKGVVFHIVWSKACVLDWKKCLNRIADSARVCWIEFDADQHLNSLVEIEKGLNSPLSIYSHLRNASDKFIWEAPLQFNLFDEQAIRLPLKMYDRSREKDYPKKDIDFFGFVDFGSRNIVTTLKLMDMLHSDGHKVCCMILDKGNYEFYKDTLPFEIVGNAEKFKVDSVTKFYGILSRSKVFVDISYRLTTGRAVYDALFHGAVGVCTNTYGATECLFSEYAVNPLMIDMPAIYQKCKRARSEWSPEAIVKFRERANKTASIDGFCKELRRISE